MRLPNHYCYRLKENPTTVQAHSLYVTSTFVWLLGWSKSGKNDKLIVLLLFRPDSESFGKWCLEKCKKHFLYDHSNTYQMCPRVLLHYTPMWIRANQKIDFSKFFQKPHRIFLFNYFTFIKNVIFWGASCWCSSKFDVVWGGAHKLQLQLLSPPLEVQFLSYINLIYLKRSHFLCR